MGILREVLSDQGMVFMSRLLQEVWGVLKIHLIRASVCHPQINRLVEKFNQTLKGRLRKFVSGEP